LIEPTPPTAPLAARLLEQEHMAIKRCRHGTFLYNLNDQFISRSLDLYGQWCEGELELLAQVIGPGDVVIDAGANIGTHTVFFARRVTTSGCVIAFEPQRMVFQNLCANIAINAILNVVARQQGLGGTRETVRLPAFDPRTEANFGCTSLRGHTEGEAVEIIRIDDLGLAGCQLIKVDVEGMEREVLEGPRETIARFQPMLFVENNRSEDSPALVSLIDSLGYDAWWQVEGYYRSDNYFGNPTNVFSTYQPEVNLFCVHRARGVAVAGYRKVSGPDDDWRRPAE
jgi:FkbM family methyltransferase